MLLEVVIFTKISDFWINIRVQKFNWKFPTILKKIVNFQQESGIPDKVGSEPAAHADKGDWKSMPSSF